MRARLLLCGVLLGVAACSWGAEPPVRLTVLAAAELADLEPLLDELERDTGVELAMDYRAPGDLLDPGGAAYDLAWPSSDRYLRIRLKDAGFRGEPPLSTSVMFSPVVVGLTPSAAAALRPPGGGAPTWADLADAAARGRFRFAMADPRTSGSGLAALVGVATAAAGTGGVLRPEDVTCDRLRGFFTGHTISAPTSGDVVDQFVSRQEETEGVIAHESTLLSLNAAGRLRQPLELVYPRDGTVVSDYPVLLLNPARRAAYDEVVGWLKSERVQREIMSRTLRRPLSPRVERDPRLAAPLGNAVYFPGEVEVLDSLLAGYAAPGRRGAERLVLLLDFSGSMAGERIRALRSAVAGLGGADRSSSGRFVRFSRSEDVTVLRFGGRVLDERTFAVGTPRGMDGLLRHLASGGFDSRTAIWSSLDRAYARAARLLKGGGRVSVVLMTDGRNNAGMSAEAFLNRSRPGAVPTFAIAFGDADRSDLRRVAEATGGRALDGGELPAALKEIRGCH
ncbi:VWA domain-containing protein [Herbidospora cretacea]|uniref:VWA domain-containing protein n=1 Tax=Herbidospora cretacea TaxID=28444 RepID=UPI000773225F|nr:VWA domain-containing protein [Herbidospora cretacea]